MKTHFTAFFFVVLVFGMVTSLRAQMTVGPAGIIVHKKAPTITEIHALGLGKMYRDPVLNAYRRPVHSGRLWVPPGERYRIAAFFQAMYVDMLRERPDPTTLQIGSLIGGSHGMASILNLLMQERGRDLVGIDRKQGRELDVVGTKFRRDVGTHFDAFLRREPNATPERRGLALFGTAERFSTPLRESLEKILTPEQMQLSYEIVFLLFGGFDSPVVDLAVLDMFGLTKEQREKLELIAEDANKKRAALLAGRTLSRLTPRDFEILHRNLQDIGRINAQKIEAVLDTDQKRYASELLKHGDEIMKQMSNER